MVLFVLKIAPSFNEFSQTRKIKIRKLIFHSIQHILLLSLKREQNQRAGGGGGRVCLLCIRSFCCIVWVFPNYGYTDPTLPSPVSFDPVIMEDAQCAESNEKYICQFLFLSYSRFCSKLSSVYHHKILYRIFFKVVKFT